MRERLLVRGLLVSLVLLCGCDGNDEVTGDPDTSTDTATDTDVSGDVPADTLPDDAGDVPGDTVTVETCEGYVEPPAHYPGSGDDCRGDADCDSGGEFCYLPGMSVCGMCPPPMRECESDTDCTDGICIEVPPPCDYCPGGNSSHCIPLCTTDSCAEGSTCNEETGLCDPISCEDGYECPPNRRCTGSGDGHGCSTLSCTSDAECDCGVCTYTGSCISGPGSCSGPVA